jgi:hypothetical protein
LIRNPTIRPTATTASTMPAIPPGDSSELLPLGGGAPVVLTAAPSSSVAKEAKKSIVGRSVGCDVGSIVGRIVGCDVGSVVGIAVGCELGSLVGIRVG